MRTVADMAKEVEATKGNRMPQLLSELGSDRDAIYESLTPTEVPPAEEPKEPEAPVEKEPEKAEFVAETPKEEKKVVPLDALHEERSKRKELAKRVRELEETVKLQTEDNKKLVELMSEKSTDEPITDYEKEMLSLRKQLKMAMSEIDNFKKTSAQREQMSTQERLERLAKQTDADLAKDGFEGFYDFIPQIVRAMDEEEIPIEERSPEVWKRIYREIVYPRYVGRFKQTQKEDRREEKKEMKRDASLIKEPGKSESKKKEEDDFDYTKWRSRQSFFNNPL